MNNNWFEECKNIMKPNVINNVKKYDAINVWQKNETAVYQFAKDMGWLKECTSHMNKSDWTKEKCLEIAKKIQKKK